jgi:DNA-directed RNA polymerase specialized sigma24 family protein
MGRVNETPGTGTPDFGEVWEQIAPAVRRSLSAVAPNVAEDVLQETGIKLMRVWETVDHDRAALPLAITIARNSLRDELRRMARHSHVELSEDHRVGDDVDARAFARLELARVEAELERLTPGQRAALLTEIGGGRRDADTPKVKMLRSRARRRLRDLVAQAGGFVGVRLRLAGGHRGAGLVPELGMLVQALLIAIVATNVAAPLVEGRPPETRRRLEARVAARSERAATERSRGDASVSSASRIVRTLAAGAPGQAAPAPGAPPPGSPLPNVPIPRSKGEANDGGYFGTEGFDFAGGGDSTHAGHDVAWAYEARWDSPECVQRLVDGGAPGTCSAPEAPHAAVEGELDGHHYEAGTGGRRR